MRFRLTSSVNLPRDAPEFFMTQVTQNLSAPAGAPGFSLKSSARLWILLGFAGLALGFLLPGHFLPWPAFRREVVAAVGVLALAIAALLQGQVLVWPRMAILVFVLAISPTLQWWSGIILFRGDALLVVMYLAAFACAICIGATLASGTHRDAFIDCFAGFVVSVSILSAGIALFQWLGPVGWEPWIESMPPRNHRAFANMMQPNQLATLLLAGVAVVLRWWEQRRIGGWSAALAAVWLGWGVVITGSRAAWVIIAVGVLWWLAMRRRAALRLRGMHVIAWLVFFVVAVLLHPALLSHVNSDSAALLAQEHSTTIRLEAGTRPIHWAVLIDAIKLAPWFGYGWNQIPMAQAAASANHPATAEWIQHSHNLVLDLLVCLGLPAGLLVCAVLLGWFVKHARGCRDATSWSLMLVLLAIFVHALLEHPLHYAMWLLVAGLLIGALGELVPRSARPWRAPRISLAVPAVALAGSLALVVHEYTRAEELLRDQRLAMVGIGAPAVAQPDPGWLLVDVWAAYLAAGTTHIKSGMPEADIERLRRIAARFSYPNLLFFYAHASAINGNPEAARQVLVHACQTNSKSTCDMLRQNWLRLQSLQPAMGAVSFPGPLESPQRK